jgi:hypothetical protein
VTLADVRTIERHGKLAACQQKQSAAAARRLPAAGRFSPPARVGAPLAGSGEGSGAGAQL